MRKSVVTAIVTTMFVVYSFYQRTIGVQATADAGPGPITDPGLTASGTVSSAPQSPSAERAPAAPTPSPAPAQAGPRRRPAASAPPRSAPPPVPQATQAPTQNSGSPYGDGTYTGVAADAFYGNIQ